MELKLIIFVYCAAGLITGLISYEIVKNKGYNNPVSWFWIGFLADILGIVLALCKPSVKERQMTSNLSTTPADDLKKYKELLDSGAITQEEYDAKKKQILNL